MGTRRHRLSVLGNRSEKKKSDRKPKTENRLLELFGLKKRLHRIGKRSGIDSLNYDIALEDYVHALADSLAKPKLRRKKRSKR